MLVKVGVLEQQWHHHLEACQKCRLLSPISELRNQNIPFHKHPPTDFVCMLMVKKHLVNDIIYIKHLILCLACNNHTIDSTCCYYYNCYFHPESSWAGTSLKNLSFLISKMGIIILSN